MHRRSPIAGAVYSVCVVIGAAYGRGGPDRLIAAESKSLGLI